ncbi:hypothetical protein F5B19DRAFT_475513 [Rostrohypoxylon terebratum]|nr:hypothetical protein F5B19DRAFT_475513 [Rostrohypoxylon terebratum]
MALSVLVRDCDLAYWKVLLLLTYYYVVVVIRSHEAVRYYLFHVYAVWLYAVLYSHI